MYKFLLVNGKSHKNDNTRYNYSYIQINGRSQITYKRYT